MTRLWIAAAALAAAPAGAEVPNWSAVAVADIEALYAETRDNHPGLHDPANPEFPALLEGARSEALDYARAATSAGGFEASIQRFKAVLNDGHAGAYAVLPDEHAPEIRWPGFVVAWRGDAMYVYKSVEGGPLAGSLIESCDGTPVGDLVRSKVFGWKDGVDIPGAWWASARLLFVDDGNPFVSKPQACRFVTDGMAADRPLDWSPIPDYYREWRNGSINGDLLPIGLDEPALGIHWIAMPDFQPDEAGVAAYRSLFNDLVQKADALRSARAVVLDLRFNNGGSSQWSRRVAEGLWGKDAVAVRAAKRFEKTAVWWRPTPGNLDHVRGFVDVLTEQGDTETAAWVANIIPLFEAAIAAGDTWLIEPAFFPASDTEGTAPEPQLTVPVYVVVPGQCASACLDAIDVFKLFANTRLIGAPSNADSTYMEVRTPALPSGMAYGIIPMKMYVDRPRGNGEFYTPDVEMSDFDWSTANFLKWIEDDLAER